MLKKTALITGLMGQDGSFLAEHLVGLGYHVIGTSHINECVYRLEKSPAVVKVEKVDLSSASDINNIIRTYKPDELYNLAARSSSRALFDDPVATAEINGIAAVRFLEAIRKISPHTRYFQAGSSELYSGCKNSPQDESTPYRPTNAYGAAKAYAANMVASYRLRYGTHASTAILFNHESPRRSLDYVSRKITYSVARIARGHAKTLNLGNLDSRRDWGFAGDYARAMWLMLQQDAAEDYVVATGATHSVRDFCDLAFKYVGLDYRDFVRIDPKLVRPPDSIELCGNPTKARQRLNWQPYVSFSDLVYMMVDADLAKF